MTTSAVGTPDRPRACATGRCRRKVFDAQMIKQKGAPVALVLDAEPRPWVEGARYKVMPGLAGTAVHKLTAAQIHKAFGNVLLYIEHSEVCEAEQRRKAAKRTEGHA